LTFETERSISTLPGERFRSLFGENYDFVWRSLRRLGVAEGGVDDAAQEVFVVAARRLDDVRPGAERPFLYQTARRVASEARRARRRKGEAVTEELLADHVDPAPTPEDVVGVRRAQALLDEILDGMDDDTRDAFLLFELEGLSKPEVASILGIPEGTAASRLRRGREFFFERAHVIQDGQLKNGGSHIGYHVSATYERGGFQVGIQGGETGAIVDLGTDDDVAGRTGVQQTGGGGNGFASLALHGQAFNDPQASALFDALGVGAEAAALDRHIYVLRIVRPRDPDLIVKMFVVSIVDGTEVSFEWIRFR
jgi:RNA polymerase sigma-70 factor (ECF subfamily)